MAIFPVETVVARAPGLHFYVFNNLRHLPDLSPPRAANNRGETHKVEKHERDSVRVIKESYNL